MLVVPTQSGGANPVTTLAINIPLLAAVLACTTRDTFVVNACLYIAAVALLACWHNVRIMAKRERTLHADRDRLADRIAIIDRNRGQA